MTSSEKRINRQIKDISDTIAARFNPQRIILFGSHAWGSPTSNSDVDLFIIQQSRKTRLERQREIRRSLFPPELAIDLFVYTPKEVERRLAMGDFFVKDIMTKGKVLYARE